MDIFTGIYSPDRNPPNFQVLFEDPSLSSRLDMGEVMGFLRGESRGCLR